MHFNQQKLLQLQDDHNDLESKLEMKVKELKKSKEENKMLTQKKRESKAALFTPTTIKTDDVIIAINYMYI